MTSLYPLLVAASLLATITSTLRVYPHQLAYFNESAGGPARGHEHLLHSNIGWEQDLLLLQEWKETHPRCVRLWLSSGTMWKPRDHGIDIIKFDEKEFIEWEQTESNDLPFAWIAVDSTELQRHGILSPVRGRTMAHERLATILEKATLQERISFSLYIYRIDRRANSPTFDRPSHEQSEQAFGI